MSHLCFEKIRPFLQESIVHPHWDEDSGQSPDELLAACLSIEARRPEADHFFLKADMLVYLLDHARISVHPHDPFADRALFGNTLIRIRDIWRRAAASGPMAEGLSKTHAAVMAHALDGNADFSHVCPDWARIFRLGLSGLLAEAAAQSTPFHRACVHIFQAMIRLTLRLAAAADHHNMPEARFAAENLRAVAEHAPESLPQALQLMFLIYYVECEGEGTIIRSLGRADTLLIPFMEADVASGRYTVEETLDFFRIFCCRVSAMNHPNNLPICFGPEDHPWTEKMLAAYDELNIYCPKIQLRIHANTPAPLLRRVLSAIRAGRSSYVLLNDDCLIPGLVDLGLAPEHAANYVPVGCYESTAMGTELNCTCTGVINFLKAVEAALYSGTDPVSGALLGADTGWDLPDWPAFEAAVYTQLSTFIQASLERSRLWEAHYPLINPAPLLSGLTETCVQRGTDAYRGGFLYNNSSINCIALGNAVDSMMAIRQAVYEEKWLTLPRLRQALSANWENAEEIRLRLLRACPKYGNGSPEADLCAQSLVHAAAKSINGQRNGRGGFFRMGLFSVDWVHPYGKNINATPDGRFYGDPLSKNLSASRGADKNGPTALANTVASLPARLAPNGAVLDLVLHPTAVQGEAGLAAMEALVRVYMKQGGQGIQMNIFDAETLKKAQLRPEDYAQLQVRVCGWNAYFISLSRAEQDLFIQQAELQ